MSAEIYLYSNHSSNGVSSCQRRCINVQEGLIIDEVEKYFPGFKAFIDSSEQEIPRPTKNKRKRKSYYSGKKKKHTIKTQYMVNGEGTILHKTGHDRGRIHMIMIFSKIK
jgi:DDE superfamily endonuclease